MDKPIPEVVVNAACEAAWPEFRSHLEGQQAWIDADPLRQNRLRLIVIQALTAALAQQPAAGECPHRTRCDCLAACKYGFAGDGATQHQEPKPCSDDAAGGGS